MAHANRQRKVTTAFLWFALDTASVECCDSGVSGQEMQLNPSLSHSLADQKFQPKFWSNLNTPRARSLRTLSFNQKVLLQKYNHTIHVVAGSLYNRSKR